MREDASKSGGGFSTLALEPRENRALCARRRPPEPAPRTPCEAERVGAREAARDEARFAIDLSR